MVLGFSCFLSCKTTKKESLKANETHQNTTVTRANPSKTINFTEALGLSPKQEMELDQIRDKFKTAMSAVGNNGETDREVLKNTIKKLQVDQLSEVEAILDESQFKTYKRLITKRN